LGKDSAMELKAQLAGAASAIGARFGFLALALPSSFGGPHGRV
jgi:hypothetical protein